MEALSRHRHLIAPAGGGLAILLGTVVLDAGLTLPLILGALVWGGTELFLSPDNRVLRQLRKHGTQFDTDAIGKELATAQERIETFRRLAKDMPRGAKRDSMDRIADAAEQIIADVARDPGDYGTTRKALAHYLPHAVKMAERLVYLETLPSADPKVMQRAERSLSDLEAVYREYTRRMVQDEAFDLDTRMDLLEREIAADGIAELKNRSQEPVGGDR